MNITEYGLGADPTAYIRKELGNGRALSEALLRNCDLQNGRVVTHMPDDVDTKSLFKYAEGGKIPHELHENPDGTRYGVPQIDPREFIVLPIYNYLKSDPRGIALFEYTCASKEDPALKNMSSKLVFFGADPFSYLGSAATLDEIRMAIGDAEDGYGFRGVLSIAPADFVPAAFPATLTRTQIDEIARMARGVVVGAYDTEGYLLWRQGP